MGVEKVDKKDIESIVIETGNRDKQSIRQLKDIQMELHAVVREETLHLKEKWHDLDHKMDESTKQFREQFNHCSQMWKKLARTVEDVLLTIKELQSTVNLPPVTPS